MLGGSKVVNYNSDCTEVTTKCGLFSRKETAIVSSTERETSAMGRARSNACIRWAPVDLRLFTLLYYNDLHPLLL